MITKFLHSLVAQPRVYDMVQKAAGFEQVGEFLAPHLAKAAGCRVLDVGGGTGNWRRFMPDTSNYLWLDCDPQKLSGYRVNQPSGEGVLADATTLCFSDRSLDYALVVGVAHHLNDIEFARLLRELARVIRHKLIFLDPVECRDRPISNLLWRYDRGRFPRTPDRLRTEFNSAFELEHTGELTIYHRYLLCVGQPRN